MGPSSSNTATVTLVKQSDTNPVAATVTYDATSKKVTLTQSSSLQSGAKYTATVKGGSQGAKMLR
jgi:Big-like domain-containing protein